ncbi:hypothetical protein CORC01_13691 [Colletotrichum orchidophilum]|uniref:Uncharacterized protein n=1 Tax=Colletotrichum orchidophilum TaxID=1209926 RepID=A0A1G4AP96_9PEZI|nr:uncharacterized protein CORC01_13691 [Colletotrichum orchidophilum]OHE91010.1 hypothetical protein CORC01_13691 [Colletotrichum orchidophilum]
MVASRDDEKGWEKIRTRIGSSGLGWVQTGSEITNEEARYHGIEPSCAKAEERHNGPRLKSQETALLFKGCKEGRAWRHTYPAPSDCKLQMQQNGQEIPGLDGRVGRVWRVTAALG